MTKADLETKLAASQGRTKLAEKRLVEATNEAKDRFDEYKLNASEVIRKAGELYSAALVRIAELEAVISGDEGEEEPDA